MGTGTPDGLLEALARAFQTTGRPGGLTQLTPEGLQLTEIAPGVDLERDVLGQMDFIPNVKKPLALMDARLFQAPAMGPKQMLEHRPMAERISFDPRTEVVFVNFAGLAIRTEEDLASIAEAVEAVCAPLGRRVRAVVNYDGFSLAPHLADAYAELVAGLTERFYERVTRFTSSAFLRLKLGASLAAHHVRPAMYESQRQALRSLKGSEPESKSRS